MECQRGDRDDRYSENVVVCGRQCRNEEILGIEKILKHGRAIPGRILAAMFLTVCVICCRAQEVFAVNGDADTLPYRCSPVSEDLSALPAMENRVYAGWEGNIYYRQYSDEDTDEGGLWAEFEPVPGTAKEIMCMKPNGSVTQVGTDYGHGDFFIVGGRIYSQKYVQTREDGRQVTHEVVYSCELDGSGVKEYSASRVLAVKGCKVICGTGGYAGYDGHGITWIDGWDGEEHVLIPGKGLCHEAEYLGATEEEVFFYRLVENGSRMRVPYDVTLYSVDYQGKVGELATVTEQEYVDCLTDDLMEYPLYISCFRILGDDLYFSVGSANGNAYMYSGGMIYRVKKDGSGLIRLVDASATEDFYLYDDGKNRALFCRLLDGRSHLFEDDMQQVVLRGKAVDDIAVRDADQTWFDQPHSYVAADGADAILFYPDTSGVCYVLLSEKESKKLSIQTHVDGHLKQQITDIEYLGGKLFFTVTDLTYSSEYSQGWRDGYERGGSVCYCKDMNSGKIRVLYRY